MSFLYQQYLEVEASGGMWTLFLITVVRDYDMRALAVSQWLKWCQRRTSAECPQRVKGCAQPKAARRET